MSLSKNQIAMLAIGGVALVVSLVLGYFAFSAYSAKSEASETAENDTAAARSLLGAAISPDMASVMAINKNRDALAGWTEAAVSTASAGDFQISTNVSEAAFKQKLVDEARELSRLPGGVDGRIMQDISAFGFPDLVSGAKMPEKDQLPRLQRLWGDVSTLVTTLSDCGVVEIVRIEPGLAKQQQAAEQKKDAKPNKRQRKRKDAEEEKPPYTEEKYAIDFRAKPAALVNVVNALVTSKRFIVVESFDFSREGDMIGVALGDGGKKDASAAQAATGRRRKKRGGDNQPREAAALSPAETQVAAEGKGVVNDPAKEGPFLVKAVVVTYDFGFAAQASGGEDQGGKPENGEKAKAKEVEE